MPSRSGISENGRVKFSEILSFMKNNKKTVKNGHNWLFQKSKLAKGLQQSGKCMFKKKMAESGSAGKESACNVDTWVPSLGWEDPLEKGKTTHSSILAWRIPWTI